MSTGRNEPCPCGSGKKYKRCCLSGGQFEGGVTSTDVSNEQQKALANSALAVGDFERARKAIGPLLEKKIVPAAVWSLACRIEMQAKAFTAAAQYGERAVRQEPRRASYLYNYATALALSGAQEQAVEYFRRALAQKPDLWAAYANLGHTLRDLGRSSEAVAAYQKGFDSGELELSILSQIVLSLHLFCTNEHEKLFEMHRSLGRKIDSQNPSDSPRRRKAERRKKIRLGYISPRFSREIVGYFFKPLFDHHDRSQFEIYLYCATPRTDDMTRYFSARADKWVEIGKLTDKALCQQIVDDEIDILVDLAGHAPENRITAIARKPAPVQVSMLDYFDTTGVQAMDYYVTDHYSTPQNSPQRFTEELIYLKQPRLVYEAPDYAPEVPKRRPGRALVFGSFNRHHKITPQVIQTWSGLLLAVPDSRLVLKSAAFSSEDVRDNFQHRFQALGVAAHRVEYRGASPHAEMLAEYGDIDIALDTFPYNGGLTTCEALWMGTPVITLLGNRLISRQTAAMLEAVGLPDFIARSPQEFADIGRYWSGERGRLGEIHATLRDRMAHSSLTDAASYTADLEQHLHRIWNRYLMSAEVTSMQRPRHSRMHINT